MNNYKPKENLSEKLKAGFAKARQKFLEEEARNNGTVVIADTDGKIKNIPAKDLLKKTI